MGDFKKSKRIVSLSDSRRSINYTRYKNGCCAAAFKESTVAVLFMFAPPIVKEIVKNSTY